MKEYRESIVMKEIRYLIEGAIRCYESEESRINYYSFILRSKGQQLVLLLKIHMAEWL